MPALSERFELRLDQETLQRVDEWRSRQDDVPSRSVAVRRLIDLGLTAGERGPLRISGAENLLIQMVGDLLRATKAKTEFDVDFLNGALQGGHLWALEMELPGVFHKHVDDRGKVSEVLNILDMWDFIELSFQKLDKKAKARVANEGGPHGSEPKFFGFDGNNESEHMGIAMFLVRDMGRFERFKAREFNSHSPVSLPMYRRMYSVFEPMRRTLTGMTMSADQIIEVLQSGVRAIKEL